MAGLLAGGIASVLGGPFVVIQGVDNPGAIPDATATTFGIKDFTFNVGLSPGFSIVDVDFQLAIVHPDVFDLSAYLRSPSGTTVELIYSATLFSGVGSNFQDTYFDDAAAGSIGTPGFDVAPFQGPTYSGGKTYRPQYYSDAVPQRLSAFNGEDPAGLWTLTIYDVIAGPDPLIDQSLFASGQSTPWGDALGTELVVTVVPEPHLFALVSGLGLVAFAASRRVRRD